MENESLFLNSLLTLKNPFNSFDDIVKWLSKRNQVTKVSVKETQFSLLENWLFDEKTLNLRHKTGKFFSVDGLRVKKDTDFITQWCQPIIIKQK